MISIPKIFSAIALVYSMIFSFQLQAQCTNVNAYTTLAAPNTAVPATFSACNWAGDYNTLTGVVAGEAYSFDDGVGGCITIHSGTPGGPVVAFGSAPLIWVAGGSGTYYIHYNVDCFFCGTAAVCLTTTVTCLSCAGPCASVTPIIGCGTSNSVSLTGTGTWDPGACGYSTPGVESIWSFTPTTSGIHSLDITSISGGFIDFMWIEAINGCGPLAPWNCVGDIFIPGNYGAMNWVAGNTYLIYIDPETTGATSVIFDVDCPNVPANAGDCATAIPVCTNVNFAIDPNGFGTIDELCVGCVSNPNVNPASMNSGCLLSGELNSTWFELNVSVGGVLEFSFGAPGGGNCFDWIMWQVTPTICADILGNTAPPIRCNWNGFCDSYTGIAGTLPAGGDPSNFEPPLAVLAGEQYLICFSNYSSAVTNVPLDFFGSASISCTPLPIEMMSFEATDLGGYNELTWKTASEANCDRFEIERSQSGVNFEVIGSQVGGGTVLSESNYRFVDYEPNPEMNYYRLKQYDFNGAYSYSDLVAISQKETTELTVVNASPNPTKNILNLQILSPFKTQVTISILSLNGTELSKFEDSVVKGGNTIAIDASDFPVGMYLMMISNPITGAQETIRFVKK